MGGVRPDHGDGPCLLTQWFPSGTHAARRRPRRRRSFPWFRSGDAGRDGGERGAWRYPRRSQSIFPSTRLDGQPIYADIRRTIVAKQRPDPAIAVAWHVGDDDPDRRDYIVVGLRRPPAIGFVDGSCETRGNVDRATPSTSPTVFIANRPPARTATAADVFWARGEVERFPRDLGFERLLC